MILALGPPIELFYFLAVYAFAAGTFVGAVAVRFVCKWLPRIGNRSVRRNVVAIPHGGQALAIAVVPILVDLGGYSVCGTAQELLVHRLGGLASAAIVLAIGLCGFSAMAALIARLWPGERRDGSKRGGLCTWHWNRRRLHSALHPTARAAGPGPGVFRRAAVPVGRHAASRN